MSRAKARFFGFAKIVTERVFSVNNYSLSIMMTKVDDSANVGIVTRRKKMDFEGIVDLLFIYILLSKNERCCTISNAHIFSRN